MGWRDRLMGKRTQQNQSPQIGSMTGTFNWRSWLGQPQDRQQPIIILPPQFAAQSPPQPPLMIQPHPTVKPRSRWWGAPPKMQVVGLARDEFGATIRQWHTLLTTGDRAAPRMCPEPGCGRAIEPGRDRCPMGHEAGFA
jgi:hypothetical protein